MQNLTPLQELTKKLDTIKEIWQIYAIFEDEKKRFNEEFLELQKDKEILLETYNATSAKNALLLAQNKELEAKNKALQIKNAELQNQQDTKEGIQDKENISDVENEVIVSLQKQSQEFLDSLKGIKELLDNLNPPEALQKLEISYQKHQRLLANPAKDYVTLESAEALFEILKNVESKIKILHTNFSKISLEIAELNKA